MAVFDRKAALFLGMGQIRGIGFKTLAEVGGVSGVAGCFERGDFEHILHQQMPNSSPEKIEDIIIDMGAKAIYELQTLGIGLVTIDDDYYPSFLLDLSIESRPKWLFYRGEYSLLKNNSVAVVGTRSPTPVGEFLTKYAVSAIAEFEIPVISGLAKGVDAIAHHWSIACSIPTISVLGTGILRPYPSGNIELADDIVNSGGLLISEYLPHATPTKQGFVYRNRIQAALARCVVSPEWKKQSGTAHTIRFAKSLGRPTVNLHMQGSVIDQDHGLADCAFTVPKEHIRFWRSLANFIYEEVRISTQKDLF